MSKESELSFSIWLSENYPEIRGTYYDKLPKYIVEDVLSRSKEEVSVDPWSIAFAIDRDGFSVGSAAMSFLRHRLKQLEIEEVKKEIKAVLK